MKIIFSPSKSQVAKILPGVSATEPQFSERSENVRALLGSLSRKKVKKLFGMSEKKIASITSLYGDERPEGGHAIATFTGTSFSSFTPSKYSSAQLSFAQEHMVIMSAVYGVLRPLDEMLMYRLDMTDSLSSVSELEGSMYEYWKSEMDRYFSRDEEILNLASDEYSKMLPERARKNMTSVSFLVRKDDILKSNSVFSKQERGMILDYIIQNQVTDIQVLKEYSSGRFTYDKDLSKEKEFIYVMQ